MEVKFGFAVGICGGGNIFVKNGCVPEVVGVDKSVGLVVGHNCEGSTVAVVVVVVGVLPTKCEEKSVGGGLIGKFVEGDSFLDGSVGVAVGNACKGGLLPVVYL